MQCNICNYKPRNGLHYRYMIHMSTHYDFLKSSAPYISTDSWIEISDFKITHKNEINSIDHLFENKKNIIFIKTELIPDIIDKLIHIHLPFTLVLSCNDDICFPHMHYISDVDGGGGSDQVYLKKIDQLLENKYLIHIFVKNISMHHKKIIPIPLGPKWAWKSCDFFGENKAYMKTIYDKYCMEVKAPFLENKKNVLYINLNANTSKYSCYKPHTNCRRDILNILSKKNYFHHETLPFDQYIPSLKSFRFCISPPGRGIDCHRTWEALLLGVIPILLSSPIDPLFDDLPVIILNSIEDFNKIDNEFLNVKHNEIIKNIGSFNFNKLMFHYWKNIIIN